MCVVLVVVIVGWIVVDEVVGDYEVYCIVGEWFGGVDVVWVWCGYGLVGEQGKGNSNSQDIMYYIIFGWDGICSMYRLVMNRLQLFSISICIGWLFSYVCRVKLSVLVVISCGIMMKKLKMFMYMFIFDVGMLLDSSVYGSERIDVQVKLMLIIDSSSQCGLWMNISEIRLVVFSYRLIRWFQCRLIVCIIGGISIVVSVVKLLQVLNSMFIQLVFLLQVVDCGLVELKWVLVIVVVVQIYMVKSVNYEKNCIYVRWCMVIGIVCRLLMMVVSMCVVGNVCVVVSSRLQLVYRFVSMYSILLFCC